MTIVFRDSIDGGRGTTEYASIDDVEPCHHFDATGQGAFRCERCQVWVCMWCEGGGHNTLCDCCWGDLNGEGWTSGDMEGVYPAIDGHEVFHEWTQACEVFS